MKQCNQWNTYDDGGNYIYYAHLVIAIPTVVEKSQQSAILS